MAVSTPGANHPCPPYKIVILDEADSMTQDAQGALRRIMEQYSRTTRFCLICNYVTRIIEPVASRCSKLRFRPLDEESTVARLKHIAESEGLLLNDDLLPALVRASEGDMRRSITYLQSVSRLASVQGGDGRQMSADTVAELAGVVPQDVIKQLGRSIGVDITEDDLSPSKDAFSRISKTVQEITREGYSCAQVVLQLHDYVILHPMLNARQKTKCALQFGETDKALMDGGNESLQLLNLSLQLHRSIVS
ncbi:Subunit of heteropentameric Replication factor C (RF-C) [Malassezia psittaci]|uniref:Subunit of heteropentameric Replication factor C (RF-C) n=1 Tax=Malassezia psittaci TaxID=1821823 RepID=A0AAF0F4V5_9BASI|nr:Subunit of heteropentameric Replication factor C (RF-C) [Malassezia psittaci]